MMNGEDRVYKGDEYFQKVLDEAGVDFPVKYLKPYLLGYLISPEHIMPSHPLEEILLQDTEMEIKFKNEEQAQKFYQCYFSLWNSLTNYIGGTRTPKLFDVNKKAKTNKEKVEALDIRGQEIVHFLMGSDESGARSYAMTHPTLFLGFDLLNMFNDAMLDFDGDWKEEYDQEMIDTAYENLLDSDKVWADTFGNISKVLNDFRLGRAEPMEEEQVLKMLDEIFENVEK